VVSPAASSKKQHQEEIMAALFSRRLSRRGALKVAGGAALLSAFSGSLAACGGIGGGGREKLTVWTDATFAPPSDDYQTQVMEEWAKSKNVDIEITREPGADVQKKLQAAVESKQFPDISQVNDGRFILFYPANVFLDVTDLYKEVGAPYGGFYKVAEQQATKNGKQYMLPYSIDSSLILYRKDILDAAGLQAPKTWDELYDQAARLQKPPELYGVGFQLNNAGTDAEGTYYTMALSFGASLVGPDSKTVTVNTPEMLNFVNYVVKQWDRGVYPPGVTGWDNAANNVNFQEERVIFIDNPASPIVWARQNKPEFLPKIGVSNIPAGPTGKSFTRAYVRDGFALFTTTPEKRQELAKDLLRKLYSKEVYTKWVELAFPAPATQGLENLDIWKNPQRGAFLEAAKTGILNGYPGEPTPAYAELSTRVPFLSMLQRVIVEKWEPKRAIEELEKVAKDIYAKHYK
jgi:multiple sugar transport system substrate-binding protein